MNYKYKIPDSKDILNFIKEKDDFNFEIRVLKVGAEKGYKCNHAGSYNDPITNKIRQFDLQFEKHFENFHLYFAIECKNLRPEFPILLSQTPRQIHESFHEVIVGKINQRNGSRTDINELLHEIDFKNYSFTIRISENNQIYSSADFVGKSISQISIDINGKPFSKNEEIYDKWIQAFGQGQSLLNEAASIYNKNKFNLNLSAIIPILVIPDNCLWVVNYDLDGNLITEPERKESGELYFAINNTYIDRHPDNFTFSHLNIYTFSGLSNFLNAIDSSPNYIEALFPKEEANKKIKSHSA